MSCCRCGNSIICRVVTILFIAAGVVMSCFAAYSCDFLSTSAGNSIGLFAYKSSDEQCVAYDESMLAMTDPFGWYQTWARVCSIIAPVLGAVVILLTMLEFCLENCCVGFSRSLLLCFAEISQGFTFAIYGSSACTLEGVNESVKDLMLGGCNISQGSIYSMVAFGLYIIGGIFLCFSPRQKSLCRNDVVEAQPQAVEKAEEKPVEKPSDGM